MPQSWAMPQSDRRPVSVIERLRRLWRALESEQVPVLTLYVVVTLLLSGALVYYLERSRNPNFASVEDGFWWALVTLTTIGYGDRYPITASGRVVAAFVILFGIGVVGIVTAKIASVLIERRIKEGRGLSEALRLSGHVIIMGWKPDMHLLLRELLAANPGLAAENVVLVNACGQDLNDGLRSEFPGLRYLRGDMTDPLVLQRARVTGAAKVLVLADATGGRSDQEVDARTVMALMNIENVAPEVYTCAEVLDHQYVSYLRLAHCDEIILSGEYSRFVLVSASASEGISQVLLKLMDASQRGGLACETIPNAFVGRTCGELAAHLRAEGGRLLLGLIENTGRPLAIRHRALREAQKTDEIAQLVANLRRATEQTPNRPLLNPPDEHVIAADTRALVLPRGRVGTIGPLR
jgi:voltage-gated potassium channel